MISVGKDYAALSGLVGYPSLFPQGVALGCIDYAPLGLMFACPLVHASEKQDFRILAWRIKKDHRWERRSPGRLFCPKGIMFRRNCLVPRSILFCEFQSSPGASRQGVARAGNSELFPRAATRSWRVWWDLNRKIRWSEALGLNEQIRHDANPTSCPIPGGAR
uniref:Uncharacterized protein n=1 Tax=Candidatus Kentrum sp. DK TaxID=2126562 RepID=A0A450S3H6_9GAMM|nr:MAG: hypothetical protein BECKDK2373C_GA0170839_101428 [Candidatus Kentron sp. DK]